MHKCKTEKKIQTKKIARPPLFSLKKIKWSVPYLNKTSLVDNFLLPTENIWIIFPIKLCNLPVVHLDWMQSRKKIIALTQKRTLTYEKM